MNYKDLLFDLDDTLFDFKACENRALKVMFERYHLGFSKELLDCYAKNNHGLWKAFELGLITKKDVLEQRFRKTFKELHIEHIGEHFEREYQDELANGAMLKKDASQIVAHLSENHRLFVVSNGVAATQYARLKASGLDSYFQQFFISEEIGYQKPQIEFMNYVRDHISEFSSASTLLIGDSESSDIKGALNLGIDSCIVGSKSELATYCIGELKELYHIVN